METSSYWILFLSVALLLNITPGPDMVYLISTTISKGKQIGFASVLGLGIGAFIHTLFVALGISAIILTSATAFKIIKYAGAIYLFYLGMINLISTKLNFNETQKQKQKQSFKKSLYQAIIIDVTNPKVALFFMAFLPQFYRNNGTSQIQQFITLGLIIILIGFFVESVIVLLSDKISNLLKKQTNIAKILNKSLGIVLIGLGIKLIL